MSDYEDKIQAKRERYAELADRKRATASASHNASRAIIGGIPMGQPILVGHHSEKRHRRDLERSDRAMRKAIEADKTADYYERKAESYGTHAISSDDPEAVAKLKAKLGNLEASHAEMKAANAALTKGVRKAKKAGAPIAAVGESDCAEEYAKVILSLEISDLLKSSMLNHMRCFSGYRPPKLDLANSNANMRRVKQRIAELEKAAAREASEPIEGEGFRIEECPEDNRIRFYFDKRPSREVCQTMKRNGFRWSRNAGAWQRQLNNAGVYAAKRMAKELFGVEC